MLCSKCGKENPEGTRFCAGCGSVIEASAPAENQYQNAPVGGTEAPAGGYGAYASSGESFMDKAKALWAKKEVKIGVIIAAVVIVVLMLMSGGGASSPEGAVENYIDAAMDCDVDKIIDCMPPQIADNMSKAMEKQGADISAIEAEMKEEIPEDAGFEVKGKEKMEKGDISMYETRLTNMAAQMAALVEIGDMSSLSDMSEYQEKMEELQEDCKVEIEEAYYVEVEIRGGGETESEKVPVGKIDGKWYLLVTDIM